MTQVRFKVKKGDLVQVTTGKNKGQRGIVQKVLLSDGKVIVEGINTVRRNIRISEMNPEGFVMKTLPIHISNVGIVDPSTDSIGKVYVRVNAEGKKERVFKKSGNIV